MGILKGRNAGNSSWTTASVVWAWVTGSPSPVKTYAKKMEVRNATNTGWERAWTDCRQHDAAGGRDWIAAPGVTEYQLSCNNRQSRVRTDYSKTGCTGYSRYTDWVASPDCTGCRTQSAIKTTSRDCGCSGSESGTYYTYTENPGSGCATYDGAVSWSGTCTGDCSTGDADCFTTSTVGVERACGACGREPGSYTHYAPKDETGCTATDSATSWSGTCNSGWYKLVPIQYFQYNYIENFLGDGVDWFGMYTAEGFWPSNNPYGGCGGGQRRVWNLYRCSHGYTDNSRNGQYEENTGVCAYPY